MEGIPEHLRRRLDFTFVERIDEVLAVALEPPRASVQRAAA